MFSVHLIDDKGNGSYLSVKGKTEWKTKHTAIKHANNIKQLSASGKFNAICVDIEDESGNLVNYKFDLRMTEKC